MSVQEYLDKYTLSRKLEDAVNAAVRAKTTDPVLFIVRIALFLPLNYLPFLCIYLSSLFLIEC